MARNSQVQSGSSVPPEAAIQKVAGPVAPHQPVWHQRLAAAVIWSLERMLTASYRKRWEADREIFSHSKEQPLIFCIWHNRLALSMIMVEYAATEFRAGKPMAAMVSASKDGALLAAVLERFGLQPVRGSTSRRGPQALKELVTWARKGYDLAITPDGPRGPCYKVQEGVIALAQLIGAPIVPATFIASRKWEFRSWDRFQLPKPFARCTMRFGPLVRVPRRGTDEQRDQWRRELEEAMLRLQE